MRVSPPLLAFDDGKVGEADEWEGWVEPLRLESRRDWRRTLEPGRVKRFGSERTRPSSGSSSSASVSVSEAERTRDGGREEPRCRREDGEDVEGKWCEEDALEDDADEPGVRTKEEEGVVEKVLVEAEEVKDALEAWERSVAGAEGARRKRLERDVGRAKPPSRSSSSSWRLVREEREEDDGRLPLKRRTEPW